MGFKPLPIGVDNFEEIIEKGYYYVDKTFFIKELLDMRGKVNLFTRPRRFGKTLNLSMLQCFFEKDYCEANQIFEGLKIMDAGEKYTQHMSKYPVISVSLKSMKQANYELSYMQMKKIIADYILNNNDRHEQNWGFLMENTSGKIIGYCPLFDHDHTFGNYQNVMSQTTDEMISLYDAAVIAQKELQMDFSGLDRMQKPELLSEQQWAEVLERKEKLQIISKMG